ncbi:MAG: SDR family oxidoreductase, partial [Acidobacteriota bacterium]
QEGYPIVGLARDFTKCGDLPEQLCTVKIDLSELAALPRRLQKLAREHQDVDGVVCNAGQGRFGSLEEFSYDQIRSLLDLNFTSQAYVARAFLPAMKERQRGDLIFIGSEAALTGGRRGAVYSASKAAVRGFAHALRDECARSGVRVCLINPGMVSTGFFDDLPFAPGDEETHSLLPQEVADVVARVLSSRAGAVFDEINLSPLKKVVRFRPAPGKEP